MDDFVAARQQHPAIESAINMVEHHGLQRIRSFGPEGVSRMVGISMIAAHLMRLGRDIRAAERERLTRQQRAASIFKHRFPADRRSLSSRPRWAATITTSLPHNTPA